MKVKVWYTIFQKKVVEVDDKFEKLESDDWYAANMDEGDVLSEELYDVVTSKVPWDADISCIMSLDNTDLYVQ